MKTRDPKQYHPGGSLVVADLWGLPPDLLRDGARLVELFRRALAEAGMQVVGEPLVHTFEGSGKGVTAAFLLRESHATFHTYPESGCLMLDVYGCGDVNTEKVVDLIHDALRPRRIVRTSIPRGNRIA